MSQLRGKKNNKIKLLWSCTLTVSSTVHESGQTQIDFNSHFATAMSAWTDIVEHSSASFEAPFSWKDCIRVSIKKIAISLLAMAISTSVLIALEHRWQSSYQSPESLSLWKLCLAFVGSGVAVTGVDWVFGGSDEKLNVQEQVYARTLYFSSDATNWRELTTLTSLDIVQRANL